MPGKKELCDIYDKVLHDCTTYGSDTQEYLDALKKAQENGLLYTRNGKCKPGEEITANQVLLFNPRTPGTGVPNAKNAFSIFTKEPDNSNLNVSYDEVLDFMGESYKPRIKIEKPHRGFWGTVRDRLFGKNNAGRKAYEKQVEEYNERIKTLEQVKDSRINHVLETKFGIEELEYNRRFLDDNEINNAIEIPGYWVPVEMNTPLRTSHVDERSNASEELEFEEIGKDNVGKISAADERGSVLKEAKTNISKGKEVTIRATNEVLSACASGNKLAEHGADAVKAFLAGDPELDTPEGRKLTDFFAKYKIGMNENGLPDDVKRFGKKICLNIAGVMPEGDITPKAAGKAVCDVCDQYFKSETASRKFMETEAAKHKEDFSIGNPQ